MSGSKPARSAPSCPRRARRPPSRAGGAHGPPAPGPVLDHALLARLLEVRAGLLPGHRRAAAVGRRVRDLLVPDRPGLGLHDHERHRRPARRRPRRLGRAGLVRRASSGRRCRSSWSARSWPPPARVFGAVDSGPGTTTAPVLITALFVIFNRFFDLICQLLRGDGRFELEAGLQSANAILFIGGSVAVIAAGYGVTAVIAVFCLKELVCCIAGWLAIRRRRAPRGRAGRPQRDGRLARLVGIGVRLSLAGIGLALAMRVPAGRARQHGDLGGARALLGGPALRRRRLRPGDHRRLRARAGDRLPRAHRAAPRAAPAAPRAHRRGRRKRGGRGARSCPWGSRSCVVSSARHSRTGPTSSGSPMAGLPACTALAICWYGVVAFDGERAPAGGGRRQPRRVHRAVRGAHPGLRRRRRGVELRRRALRRGAPEPGRAQTPPEPRAAGR